MQKMVDFYHNKEIDMLKLGITFPNLANIFLHKSTTVKFYPFTESRKNFLDEIREEMVGGPSIVFARKAVVDELSLGFWQTCVKVLSEMMLVSFILSLCVEQNQLVCTRVGN